MKDYRIRNHFKKVLILQILINLHLAFQIENFPLQIEIIYIFFSLRALQKHLNKICLFYGMKGQKQEAKFLTLKKLHPLKLLQKSSIKFYLSLLENNLLKIVFYKPRK